MEVQMSIDLSCDWKSGFVLNPTKKQRCGYLMAFNGLGLDQEIGKDNDAFKIRVFTPFNSAGTPEYPNVTIEPNDGQGVLDCIGIIESFHFEGGVGDPICISAYVSSEFANQLKAKQKASLATTTISKLGWWIVNYDVDDKSWFEEAYPKGKSGATDGFVKGQLNAGGGTDIRLSIADSPTMIASNMDVQVFNIYFEIVPASDSTYALAFRQGTTKAFVKGWGLQVGSVAKQKLDSAA
jgi:hypothetical protein